MFSVLQVLLSWRLAAKAHFINAHRAKTVPVQVRDTFFHLKNQKYFFIASSLFSRKLAQIFLLPCSHCPRSFAQKSNLLSHVRSHTGDRPFLCAECGGAFGTAATLHKHEKTHTGERPWRCHYCGKRYRQKASHDRHIMTHTKEWKHKLVGMQQK